MDAGLFASSAVGEHRKWKFPFPYGAEDSSSSAVPPMGGKAVGRPGVSEAKRGIYVSEVDEVDGPDGTEYRARLKSHPHIAATASNPDAALRALDVVRDIINVKRVFLGMLPLTPDGQKGAGPLKATPPGGFGKTLTGKLHK